MTIEIKDLNHVYGDDSDHGSVCAACVAHPELAPDIQTALIAFVSAIQADGIAKLVEAKEASDKALSDALATARQQMKSALKERDAALATEQAAAREQLGSADQAIKDLQASCSEKIKAANAERDEAKAALEKTLAFQKDLVARAIQHVQAADLNSLDALIAEAQKPEVDRQKEALDKQIAALMTQREGLGA